MAMGERIRFSGSAFSFRAWRMEGARYAVLRVTVRDVQQITVLSLTDERSCAFLVSFLRPFLSITLLYQRREITLCPWE